jgi:hypothetical protein
VAVVLGGWVLLGSKTQPPAQPFGDGSSITDMPPVPKPSTQTPAAETNSVQQAPAATTTIDQDLQSIDSQTQSLNSDTANIDAGLSDSATTVK